MKLVNTKTLLKNVAAEWKIRYFNKQNNSWVSFFNDAEKIYKALVDLGETPKLEDVKKLVPDIWLYVICSSCGKEVNSAVEINKFVICKSCMSDINSIMNEKEYNIKGEINVL